MNKQKIYLTDENELVIITDNGRQGKDNITTNIKGEFIVDQNTAVKLFGVINNQALLYRSITTYSNDYPYLPPVSYDIIVDKKDNVDLISHLKEEIGKLSERFSKEHRNYTHEVNSLKEQIKQFNESRHCWERKLVIK